MLVIIITFYIPGQQLEYNYPKIYDHKLPSAYEKENPQMVAALNGKHVTSSPWNGTVSLATSGGTEFISFAKFSSFGEGMWLIATHTACFNCILSYKLVIDLLVLMFIQRFWYQ